ncbi:protein cbp-1-like [Uranotaenia lowii]|uniref:protein cbp-1-like n=1 Tax=Uranotaenia lowii TaxID=190385 RepID=UPI00247B0101|nr:protein cbp-1-like [Uranotaenia lowii]
MVPADSQTDGAARKEPRGPVGDVPASTSDWQRSVSSDLRNQIVLRVVQAIFPMLNPAIMGDKRMACLMTFARKVETDAFELALSCPEYYHFIAEKIDRIEKEMADKRYLRRLIKLRSRRD